MANKYSDLKGLFTAIAEAIREKTGEEAKIIADDFPEAIAQIEAGSGADVFGGIYSRSSATQMTIPVRDIGFIPKKFWLMCPMPNSSIGNYTYVNSVYWAETDGVYYATYKYDCSALGSSDVTASVGSGEVGITTQASRPFASVPYIFMAFRDEAYTNI